MNNKETFRELLGELKCCCDVASDVLLKHYSNKFEDITSITFDITTHDEVEEDVEFLWKKLIHKNKEEDFKYHGLTKYLLQRLEDLHCMEGRDLKLLSNTKDLEFIGPID